MARLTRWGNSAGGLRIPKAILEAAGLRVGDEIGCRLMDDGTIRLTPCKEQVKAVDIRLEPTAGEPLIPKW